MVRLLILLASIVGTWLVHVAFVTTYMKHFASTHTVAFRLVYAIELATTFSLMLIIYLSKVHNPAGLGLVLVTTIGYLTTADTALTLTQASVRSSFDIYHFVAAYALTICVLTIIYKVMTK